MHIGHTVSHYTILERIGQGGMGTVYRAKDTKLGRVVAIKVLPPGFGSDDEQRERFLQEARAESSLDHPNIGSVFEIDESPEGELFIAMAYYEGKTLKDRLKDGPLDLKECLGIGSQIGRGMGEAHAHGIVHRDLKPANIILTAQGLAKIIDFGLAKFSGGLQLTRAGSSLGTLAYMSPEQLRGEEAGADADIWALGIILFEMLTGKHPFHGEFEASLMYSIANEPPLSLATFRPDAPQALDALLGRMLSKIHSDRPSTMGEVADILDRLLHGESSDILPLAPATGTPSGSAGSPVSIRSVIRFLGGKRGMIAASAALVVLAAALYLLFRPRPGPSTPAEAPSIAVVPFAVSGEEELRYLGDGVASEIARVLSKAPDLVVIARTSSKAFSQSTVSDSTIAYTLGVRYVVRGSVRVTTAQIFYDIILYDHSGGLVILSRNSSVSRKDLLRLPGVIGDEIARLIDVDLPRAAIDPATLSPAAYESYLQGHYYYDRLNKEDLELSLVYYRHAIEADSAFLLSKLNYASTVVEGFRQGYLAEKGELSKGEALCRGVLSADSLNDIALAILGDILDLKGDRAGGLRSLNRALEINPDNAFALTSLSLMYIVQLNDPVRGIVLLKRLKQFDPLNWLTNLNLGAAYAQSRQYKEALLALKESAEQNPSHPFPVYSMGYLHEILGQFDSAAARYAEAIALDPSEPMAYTALIALDLARGKHHAADSLADVALKKIPGNHVLLYLRGMSLVLGKKNPESSRVMDEGYRLVSGRLEQEPGSVQYTIYKGLFSARLGRTDEAIAMARQASKLDSTHSESIFDISRIYAALGMKDSAIAWFSRARGMNPEFNEAYLATAVDYELLRRDPDLLLAARR